MEHYRKSVPASLIRLSRLRREKTQSSSSDHNGALPLSEHTTRLIELARLVKDVDTLCIAGTTSPYVNPLDANDVSDSEQYQGCRMPSNAPVGLPTDDKTRKEDYPLYSFMFGYFPDAWLAVVQVAVAGNKQHNPGQPLHWARGKSMDQMNTAWRHQWDYGRGVKRDTDGQYHLAKAAWRILAQLQLDIEEERRQNGDK